jgi:ABC-type nitrate/sulfonate/bicarbonate transport system permease component
MLALALVVVLLGAWEAVVRLGAVDAIILPAPDQIAVALHDDAGLLFAQFAITAEEIVLGLLVAVGVAVLATVAIHFSRPVRRALYPLLVASQSVPIAIVAPLLVALLGFALAPKLGIVALICFFPVTVGALDGLARVDPALLKLMRTLGASRTQSFLRVQAPAALPGLLSGAKVAVAVAVIGADLAELAGSDAGLGHLIQQASAQLDSARAYAGVVILAGFGVVLFAALTLVEHHALPWTARTGELQTA